MRSSRQLAFAARCAVLAAMVVTTATAQGNASLPPAKQAIVATEQARQAIAEQGPKAPKPLTPPLVTSCPIDVTALKTGIAPFRQGLMPPRGVNPINTALVVSADGVPYTVYAGSRSDAPRQGAIVVWEGQVDPCAVNAGLAPHPQPQLYVTPFQEGAVHITQIDGDHIVFATVEGRGGRFNYVAGRYE